MHLMASKSCTEYLLSLFCLLSVEMEIVNLIVFWKVSFQFEPAKINRVKVEFQQELSTMPIPHIINKT